jgi:hypothetical protein
VANFLALDWDQNQLHLIAAKISGSRVTVHKACVWQEEKSPNPADVEELGRLLRERIKEAGIAPAPVLACVGRDRFILRELRYPAVPEAEEAALVRFQAVKELTDAPEDVVLDYVPVGDRKAPEQHALALSARRELVNAYQALCQAAGLKLAALTPRAFGMAASARKVIGTTALTPSPDPPDGAIAVIAVGGTWAEFCVLQGDTLLFTRALTVDPHLAGVIRRNLAVYAGQAARPPVCAVYLTGAASGELREHLADLLDLPIHSFDPFAGAEGLTLAPAQRGGFAGAAGLLYTRAATGSLPINFVQPRQPRKQADPHRRTLVQAALLIILVLMGGVGFYVLYKDTPQHRIRTLEAEIASLDAQLGSSKEVSSRIKGLDAWDTPNWADEIYELTHNIPDVNALRVSLVTFEPPTTNNKTHEPAKISIKGTLADGASSRVPVDKLAAAFDRLHYTPRLVSVEGNQFTIIVNVDRRPPGDYKNVLKPAAK